MSDETIPYLVMVENIQQMSDETIPLWVTVETIQQMGDGWDYSTDE
jgi:hypothetical protein